VKISGVVAAVAISFLLLVEFLAAKSKSQGIFDLTSSGTRAKPVC
jgi:hypothetical protein